MSSFEVISSKIDKAPNVARTKLSLFLDDEELSSLFIVNHELVVRKTAVRMAGIAGVYTPPQQRMKGYARRLLAYCLDYMRQQQFDVSILFGITGLYPKFGYAPCMGEHYLRVKTADARRAPSRYSYRQATPEDGALITSIYQQENCQRTGTILRDPGRWNWFRKGSVWHTRVKALLIVDGDQVVGYLVYDDVKDKFTVPELGAKRRDAFADILRRSGELAAKLRQDEITFIVPPDCGFAGFCKSIGCEVESTYPSDGGAMGRIINQKSLFAKLSGELSTRTATSSLKEEQLVLEIRSDLESTFIKLDRGRASLIAQADKAELVELRQDRLWQLLMGYYGIDDLLALDKVAGSARALQTLRTLFPPETPFMWPPDHF